MAMNAREAALQARIEDLKAQLAMVSDATAAEYEGQLAHLRAREDQQMRFAAGVEREACARLADAVREYENNGGNCYKWETAGDLADAIRARGHV